MAHLLFIQNNKTVSLLQNVGTLALLFIALPFNLIIVLTAWVINFLRKPFEKKVIAENPKRILITVP